GALDWTTRFLSRVAAKESSTATRLKQDNSAYNPKTNSADPAGIATNCLPSTAKDMGLDRIAAPSCKSQSGLPFSASNAKKFPSSVPPNTRPPAVDRRPAIGGVRSLNSQRSFPVAASQALTAANATSPSMRRPPPAVYAVPGL